MKVIKIEIHTTEKPRLNTITQSSSDILDVLKKYIINGYCLWYKNAPDQLAVIQAITFCGNLRFTKADPSGRAV
jgi:hypothetical protein